METINTTTITDNHIKTEQKTIKEFYKSSRVKNKILIFSVEYNMNYTETKLSTDEEPYITLNISAEIRYFPRIDSEYKNIWNLKTMVVPSNKSCTLNSSVMINPQFRGFGVGKLVLHGMLSIAKDKIPNYSLKGTLATGDGTGDNGIRRDKLYKHVGFNMEKDEFNIDKISNLKINPVVIDIKKMDIKDVFENETLKKEIESLYNMDEDRVENIIKCSRDKGMLIKIIIFLIVILPGLFTLFNSYV